MASKVSIRVAAKRTGLTTHVIRAWQKRYNLLNPARSEGGHRLFSEADVQRLSLLARAVNAGHRIRSIAHLSDNQLMLLMEKSASGIQTGAPKLAPTELAGKYIDQILELLPTFNTRGINSILEQAEVNLGWQGLLQLVIAPTAYEMGTRWRAGLLNAAHEHLFTSTIKVFLGNLAKQYLTPKYAPRMVICTPFGQIHELGAILATAAAANIGWDIAYLGPNLPAGDIVGAVNSFGARVLGLSLVYPEDDPYLPRELLDIRRRLPKDVQILVGGRACASYAAALENIGATVVPNLTDLCAELDEIRRQIPPTVQTAGEDQLTPSIL